MLFPVVTEAKRESMKVTIKLVRVLFLGLVWVGILSSCEDTDRVDRLTSEVESLESRIESLKEDLKVCEGRKYLIKGEFSLDRGKHKSFYIDLKSEDVTGDIHVGGNFESSENVRVFVTDFANYQLFRGGLGYKTQYDSDQNIKSGQIDLKLEPGDYYVVVWYDRKCFFLQACPDAVVNAEFFYEGIFK